MNDESRSLEGLMALIRKFIRERNWESFHTPEALAISASIEMGELLEKFQWLKNSEINNLLLDTKYRNELADEIADVMIYLLRLSDVAGIDPSEAILTKMKKNESKYPADDWLGRIPDKVRTDL